jgi:ribosome maturation factor RimP
MTRPFTMSRNDLVEAIKNENEFFSRFEGKKVVIQRHAANGLEEMKGRIEKHPTDDRYVFYEGRKRKRFYNLTLGVFDGFAYTLTIKDVKEV